MALRTGEKSFLCVCACELYFDHVSNISLRTLLSAVATFDRLACCFLSPCELTGTIDVGLPVRVLFPSNDLSSSFTLRWAFSPYRECHPYVVHDLFAYVSIVPLSGDLPAGEECVRRVTIFPCLFCIYSPL